MAASLIIPPKTSLTGKFAMVPYHILIVIISSVIPENLVFLTKSEQSCPKSAHIRPTIKATGFPFGGIIFGSSHLQTLSG